jgi:hypothetical protein
MGPSVISWWPSGTSELVSLLMVVRVGLKLVDVCASDEMMVLLLRSWMS